MQCVYCRLPDGPKGYDNFGVDHYLPKRDFPELARLYSNLFYACNCCNRRKGRFWPNPDELRKGRFIPNPCDHVMFDHLRYRGALVNPRSEAGKQADKILDFNDDESIKYRELILDMIEYTESQKRLVEQNLHIINGRIAIQPTPQLIAEKQAAEKNRARVVANLRRLGA